MTVESLGPFAATQDSCAAVSSDFYITTGIDSNPPTEAENR